MKIIFSAAISVPADCPPPEVEAILAALETAAVTLGGKIVDFDVKPKSDKVMKDSETTPDRRSTEDGQVPAPYLISPAENKDGKTPDEDDDKVSEDDSKASKTTDYYVSPDAKKDGKTSGLSKADDDAHVHPASAPEDKSIEGTGKKDETASVGDDIDSDPTKKPSEFVSGENLETEKPSEFVSEENLETEKPSEFVSEENLETEKPSESEMVLEITVLPTDAADTVVSPTDDPPSVRDDTKKSPTDTPADVVTTHDPTGMDVSLTDDPTSVRDDSNPTGTDHTTASPTRITDKAVTGTAGGSDSGANLSPTGTGPTTTSPTTPSTNNDKAVPPTDGGSATSSADMSPPGIDRHTDAAEQENEEWGTTPFSKEPLKLFQLVAGDNATADWQEVIGEVTDGKSNVLVLKEKEDKDTKPPARKLYTGFRETIQDAMDKATHIDFTAEPRKTSPGDKISVPLMDPDEEFFNVRHDDEESVTDEVKGRNEEGGEKARPKEDESSDDDSSDDGVKGRNEERGGKARPKEPESSDDDSDDENNVVVFLGVKEAPAKSNSKSDSSSVSSESSQDDSVLNLEAGKARAKEFERKTIESARAHDIAASTESEDSTGGDNSNSATVGKKDTAASTGGDNSNSASVGGPTRATELVSKKGGQARAKAGTTNKSSGTSNLSGSKRKSTETDFFTYGGASEQPPKKKTRTKYVPYRGPTPKKIVKNINEAIGYLEGSATFNKSNDVIENLKKQKDFLIKKVRAEYKKRKEALEEGGEEEDMEVDGVDEPSTMPGRRNDEGEGGAPGASGVTA